MRSFIAAAVSLALAVSAAPRQQVIDVSESITAIHLGGPPKPPPVFDLSEYTIAEILDWTLEHPPTKPGDPDHEPHRRFPYPPPRSPDGHPTLPLHKLGWVVNKTEHIKAILSDEKANITLFAPEDSGLPDGPPHRHSPHHGHDHDHDHGHDDEGESAKALFASMMATMKDGGHDGGDDGDDGGDEEKKRKLKKLVEIILHYHILPGGGYSGLELADLSSAATSLPYSTDKDADHFRIRIRPTLVPAPSLKVNFYARTRTEVQAKNGRIHLISAPLLPPLSHLSEAFLFPQVFSTLTTAVQKVELDNVLAPWIHHREEHKVDSLVHKILGELMSEHSPIEGKAIFTVFAPINLAFARLGFKINAFLFSPFGHKLLKDVLAYHVVPGVSFFTDYEHGLPTPDSIERVEVDLEEIAVETMHGGIEMQPAHHGHADVAHYTLPTLLGDQKIRASVFTYRLGFGHGPLYRRLIVKPEVGDEKPVYIPDVPVWGGAIHAIGTILRPSLEHHEHGHHFAEL